MGRVLHESLRQPLAKAKAALHGAEAGAHQTGGRTVRGAHCQMVIARASQRFGGRGQRVDRGAARRVQAVHERVGRLEALRIGDWGVKNSKRCIRMRIYEVNTNDRSTPIGSEIDIVSKVQSLSSPPPICIPAQSPHS